MNKNTQMRIAECGKKTNHAQVKGTSFCRCGHAMFTMPEKYARCGDPRGGGGRTLLSTARPPGTARFRVWPMSEYEYFDLHEFNRNEKWGQEKEEDTQMDQPGKTDLKQEYSTPKLTPITYAQRNTLPLLTEDEIVERAAYYDREWEARSGGTKQGWQRLHPTKVQVSWRVAFAATVTVIVAIAFVWAVVRL